MNFKGQLFLSAHFSLATNNILKLCKKIKFFFFCQQIN